MNYDIRNKPLVMMTGEDIIHLVEVAVEKNNSQPSKKKQLVYGLSGLSELFQCSLSTATRLKKSGILDPAITQVGRKIIIDAELALALLSSRKEEMSDGF
ncbi:MAG: DUF3853 family protein [Prevotella sp.]|nr:DUF3853 family protein [Prevotella sp.]